MQQSATSMGQSRCQSAFDALPAAFGPAALPPSDPAADGSLVFSTFGGIDLGPSEQPIATNRAATTAPRIKPTRLIECSSDLVRDRGRIIRIAVLHSGQLLVKPPVPGLVI